MTRPVQRPADTSIPVVTEKSVSDIRLSLSRLCGCEISPLALRALEPRVVFDGAGAVLGAEMAEQAEDVGPAPIDTTEASAEAGQHEALIEAIAEAAMADAASAQGEILVFIDGAVGNADAIASSAPEGAEVVMLDADSDGVGQIAEYVTGRSGIAAIHIVSHGGPGALNLGSTVLDAASISGEHADELAVISASLAETADLLIYGCDFGADFLAVSALAAATGADVAASSDDTGSVDFGGNWDLEVATGAVAAAGLNAPAWSGLLAPGDPILDLDTADNSVPPVASGNATAGQLGVNNPIGGFTATNSNATGTFNVSTTTSTGFDEGFTMLADNDGVAVTFLDANGNSDGAGGAADGFVIQFDAGADNNSRLDGIVLSHGVAGSGDENAKDMTLTWTGGVATIFDPDGQLAIVATGGATTPANGQTISSGAVIRTVGASVAPSSTTWSVFVPTESLRVEATAIDRPVGAGTSNDLLNETLTFNVVLSELGHEATYIEGGDAVSIASPNIALTDDGQITRAEATFSVIGLAGDRLVVDPAQLPTGITVDAASTTTSIILTGTASPADYAAALQAIRFETVGDHPDVETVRNIEVTVTDDASNASKVVNTLITVLPDNDYDGVIDSIDVDDDNDGILDTVENAPITLNLVPVPSKSSASLIVLEDSSGNYRLEITKGDNPHLIDFNPTTGRIGNPSTAGIVTEVASLVYSTANSPISFELDIVQFNQINSMSTTSVRDSYAASVAGTWEPVGTPAAAVVAVDASDVSNADGDGFAVGAVVRDDADWVGANGTVPSAVRSFQHLIDADQGGTGDGDGTVSDVLVNFGGSTEGHVARLLLDDKQTEFQLYIFDAGQSGMAWNYIPTTSVTILPDSDGDGISDGHDIDSDNDGILDNIEAQGTTAYIAPSGGVGSGFIDANGDGLDDTYDDTTVAGQAAGFVGQGIAPADSDGDGEGDWRDFDSDNDLVLDRNENGLTVAASSADTDFDGLLDDYEGADVNDAFNVNEGIADPLASHLPDADGDAAAGVPLSADLDYRDTSFDNAPPVIDLNDDNTTADLSYAATFDEGDAPVAVADTDADAIDLNDNITSLTVVAAGQADGASEIVRIAGQDVPLNANASFSGISFGGQSLNIAYVASSGTFTVTNATGATNPIPQSVLDMLVRGMTYENTSQDPPAGNRTLTFGLTDAAGLTSTPAVSTITVAPVNDPPVSTPLPDRSNADSQGVSLDVSAAFSDPDASDTLTFTASGLPPGLTISNAGVISGTLTANASQSGPYAVTVTATDTSLVPTSQTFAWTIANPPPVAQNDALTGSEDADVTTSLFVDNGSGADNDPDGDTIVVSRVVSGNDVTALTALADGTGVGAAVAGSNGGTFTVAANGQVTFAPGDDFNGLGAGQTAVTEVVYQIDDGNGGTDTAVVTYTVTGVNDAPIPVDPTQPAIDPANPPTGIPFDPQDPHAPPTDPQAYIPGQPGLDSAAVTPLDLTPYFGDPDSPDAVTLSLDPADLPPGLTFNGSTISGTPTSNASQGGDPLNPGTYVIPVTATDPTGATFTTNVTYTITNPPPVAQNDTLTGNEDANVTTSLFVSNGSGADNDPDGDTIVVSRVVSGNDVTALAALADGTGVATAVAGSNGGTFTVAANGNVTFAPGDDFNGLGAGQTAVTEVVYQIDDGNGGTDTAVVTYTVTGVNDAPIPVDPTQPAIDPANPPAGIPFDPQNPHAPPTDPQSYIPAQPGLDSAAVTPLDLTPYFGDPDSPDAVTLSLDPADLPPGLTFNGTTISGTPTSNASQGGDPLNPGTYVIPVTATDPSGATFTTNVTYTIANPPPVAQNDALTGSEDADVTTSLFVDNGSGADIDPDGDTIVVSRVVSGNDVADLAPLADGTGVGTAVAGSNGGSFTVAANGQVTFAPGDDFNGLGAGQTAVTEVVYQIDDGNGGTDTAVVTYTVTGVNDAPIPVDPTQPTIDPNNPPTGIPFDPQDPHAPPADPQSYIPAQPGLDSAAVTPLDLTPYFGDPDSPDAVTLSLDPADLPPGLTFNGTTISGTPTSNASQGGDPLNPGTYVIPVTATDPTGATFTTNVTYTIANPAPVAQNDVLTGSEDADVTTSLFVDNGSGADIDPDGDTIVVSRVVSGNDVADLAPLADGTGVGTAVAGSNGGTFTVAANGNVTFAPGDDFNGLGVGQTAVTEVVYQIDDGNGGTDTAVVTYTVTGVNDAPIPVDPTQPVIDPNNPPTGVPFDPQDPHAPPTDPQSYIPAQPGLDSAAVTPLDLTPYFGDPDSPDAVTLSLDPADLPPGLTFNGTTISGTPTSNASQGGDPLNPGTYVIPVTATDPSGATFTTNVTYTIANPPPVAGDDVAKTIENGPVTVPVLVNDIDPDGDPLSVALATAANGTMTINPGGTLIYTPAPGFAGTDTITYTLDDGNGGTDLAFVTVTVEPAPVSFPLQIAQSTAGPDLAPPPLQPPGTPILGGVVGQLGSNAIFGINANSNGTGLGERLVVLEAVNEAGELGGVRSNDEGLGIEVDGVILSESQRINRLWLRETSDLTSSLPPTWQVENISGFSIRLDDAFGLNAAVDAAAFTVDSIVRDGVVVLTLEAPPANLASADLLDYRITLSDGRALPDWLERQGLDSLQGRPPIGLESIELKVTGILANDTTVSQILRIDLTTGAITAGADQRAGAAPAMFADQFHALTQITPEESEVLAAALSR